jgi:DNA-binding NarL/FixJ family response regulator
MYVLRDASHERRDRSPGSSEEGKPGGLQLLSEDGPPVRNRAPADPALAPAADPQILIYLDAQAFTRDCVGYWLQSSLSGFHVCLFQDPEQIMNASVDSGRIRAVLVNTGPGRMSSGAVAGLLARVGELLPTVPVAVLSDYEDAEKIREAFALGVFRAISYFWSLETVCQRICVCSGRATSASTKPRSPASRSLSRRIRARFRPRPRSATGIQWPFRARS